MSIWWLILPTVIYGLATFNVTGFVILAVLGLGIKIAQARPAIPASICAVLPLLQWAVMFVLFGANIFVVGILGAALAAAFLHMDRVIAALRPWWKIQSFIPQRARYVVAFIVSLWIGYHFGVAAQGTEWTSTFLSIACATVVTVLLTFTPPDSARPESAGT